MGVEPAHPQVADIVREGMARNIKRNPTRVKTARSDSQNVHDSAIVTAFAKEAERLRKEVGTPQQLETSLKEIRTYLESQPNHNDSIKALDQMEITNARATGINAGELESLNLVWSYIKKQPDGNVKDNLMSSFHEHIRDCINPNSSCGGTYCTSGKIERILDTLTGIDEKTVEKRPIWAVQQMMVHKGSAIQKEMLEKAPQNIKAILSKTTRLNEQEMNELDNYTVGIKSIIRQELKKDFLDSGVLNSQQFEKESQWIEAI